MTVVDELHLTLVHKKQATISQDSIFLKENAT